MVKDKAYIMKYYFEDPAKQKELKIILDEWIGTPYRYFSGVKGIGCDCAHFVLMIAHEMKIIIFDKKTVPYYPSDWHAHNTRELILEEMENRFHIETIKAPCDMLNGDIILFHGGKASSHMGFYYDNYVYQSLDPIGVCKIIFTDQKFFKRMRFILRILK